MAFKPSVEAAHTPRQMAWGQTPQGKGVVFCYLPQWKEILREVAEGESGIEYVWVHQQEDSTYLLFIRWQTGQEIAIAFPESDAGEVLAQLENSCDLVLTLTPVNTLATHGVLSEQTLAQAMEQGLVLRGIHFSPQHALEW